MKCVLEKFVNLCRNGAQYRHAVTSSVQSCRSLVSGKSAVGELPRSACLGQTRSGDGCPWSILLPSCTATVRQARYRPRYCPGHLEMHSRCNLRTQGHFIAALCGKRIAQHVLRLSWLICMRPQRHSPNDCLGGEEALHVACPISLGLLLMTSASTCTTSPASAGVSIQPSRRCTVMSVLLASSLTTSCFSQSPGSTAATLYLTGGACRTKVLGHKVQPERSCQALLATVQP